MQSAAPRRPLLLAALAAAACAAVLAGPAAAAKPLPALAPAPTPGDGLARALASGEVSEPSYALQRALSLFRLGTVRSRFPAAAKPGPRDATLVLRDLAARVDRLSPAEREQARRLLARPTDGVADPLGQGYTVASEVSCTVHICFHWVESTADAPPGADGDGATVPAWITTTQTVLEEVWTHQVDVLGYRPPLSDATSPENGGDGRLDIYLADIGGQGYYGYCTTDDPNANPAGGYEFYDVSAYCVLDNDFDPSQFPSPGANGLAALQVTAAHEFFHAVQYGYDWLEDVWLMEGSASWIEDEHYDDVNDNRWYLAAASPLVRPSRPVDHGAAGHQYGAWIFWRYLSEAFGAGTASDPAIVRQVWALADANASGPDAYSLQAVRQALAARGAVFETVFGDFAARNRIARRWYEEGAGAYPIPPTAARYVLSPRRPTTGWRAPTLQHLSSRYTSLVPARTVSRSARLRLRLDLPASATGARANALIVYQNGSVGVRRIALTSAGDRVTAVPFGRGVVKRVDLVLTNASRRFDCWWDTVFSCGGIALDDGRAYRFRAALR